ncbi:MAG TPA: bifunctional UDP-N-acetylglucosamine diphosphorylase/glucosamine-1-phosphate N-acetyltransferase GlmU [Thermoanaerobaculia bacterium]|nr:bifunctional UDP-N-acetylglucosamine diphosphorylase/glucosamine-1-phosphate N-acetyltransferase GlmU [Thermoanaerobaculia bacterium]
MSNDNIRVVVLAAGQGKRMKSSRIKVLHRAGGQALIDYVLDLAGQVSTQKPIVIIGHDRDAVRAHCGDRAQFAIQERQLGTGHAVLQARPLITSSAAAILVLSGDVPLTRLETLEKLVEEHRASANAVTLLSMKLDEPAGYGRVIRSSDGAVARIVEAKDATEEEKRVGEVNAGIYVFDAARLFDDLAALSSNNAQGEYYLTDVIGAATKRGERVGAMIADPIEALGVNSRADLAAVEKELSRRTIERLMVAGVTFRNPESTLIDGGVTIGKDTIVYPFVTLEGKTVIGSDCVIFPGSHLIDVRVGDRVTIKTGTVAEESVIENDASVGPYAHLRAGTVLGAKVKVGNFVETKKAVFGKGAKASHLSYIGDADIGEDVNIGAGTITCNYDGVNKNKTILEDGVFIGSDTQLVAPVRVGKGAYVGAGSTITKDVPPDALALSRSPQKIIEGWAARRRGEIAEKKKK